MKRLAPTLTLLKLAARPWRSSPFQQVVSVVTVGIILYSVLFLFALSAAFRRSSDSYVRRGVATIFIEPDHKEIDGLKAGLESIMKAPVEYVDASLFVDRLGELEPRLAAELKAMPEGSVIIPRYFVASEMMSKEMLQKVRALSGVEAVDTTENRIKTIVESIGGISKFAQVGAWVLLGVLVCALSLIARVHYVGFSATQGLLRLWGASESAAQMPSILSLLIIALTGSALAIGLYLGLTPVLLESLAQLSPVFQALEHAFSVQGSLALLSGVLLLVFGATVLAFFVSHRAQVSTDRATEAG